MLILTILDGVGIGDRNYKYNAVFQGQMPNFVRFLEKYPNSRLETSGLAVGLPEGQMGNSEVGHMTIGSGRVIYQDLPRINNAIKSGELLEKLENAELSQTVHIIGLCSSGGVHSSLEHILYIYQEIKNLGKTPILHVITDGRDVPPKDFITTLSQFEGINIGTISGRFYAMDRDKRHERTQTYINALLSKCDRNFADIKTTVQNSYDKDIADEFIKPATIGNFAGIKQGESIIMANFRADRARQTTTALLELGLAKNIICMTHYSNEIAQKTTVLFPQTQIINTLSQVLEKHGKKHLHIAETEKYAHVTFFFNGGIEAEGEFEERILIPSPKVATYDLKPEMSIYELQEVVLKKIKENACDFMVINIANGDMVGHSGNFEAAKIAGNHIDTFLKNIEKVVLDCGHEMLITADHGNIEEMIDTQTGEIHTQHTMGVVPLIYIGKRNIKLKNGSLANIAGTVLKLMGIPKPSEIQEGLFMKIYHATTKDISFMVQLSHKKRLEYSKHQPNFWKMAENSDEIQAKWFEEELQNPSVITLCHENQMGFIMGKIVSPPEVYNSGLTLMIDDFCVQEDSLWPTVGKALLEKCIDFCQGKAKQVLVVCGNHDAPKYKMLESMNLTIASKWYTAKI